MSQSYKHRTKRKKFILAEAHKSIDYGLLLFAEGLKMKIGFRQGLAAAVSALLLFSSAGARAACEDEGKAYGEAHRIFNRETIEWGVKSGVTALKGQREYVSTLSQEERRRRIVAIEKEYEYRKSNPSYDNSIGERNFHMAANKLSLCVLRGDSGLPSPISSQNQSQEKITTSQQQRAESQQRQQAQAAVELAQDNARIGQARADASAQRAGRRTHDPAAEAHECVQLDNPASAYPVNNCAFKINVAMCVTDPRSTNNFFNANDSFQCQNLKTGGLWSPEAGRPIQGIVPKSVGMIYWFACKAPSNPSDTEFTGSAISARCN